MGQCGIMRNRGRQESREGTHDLTSSLGWGNVGHAYFRRSIEGGAQPSMKKSFQNVIRLSLSLSASPLPPVSLPSSACFPAAALIYSFQVSG